MFNLIGKKKIYMYIIFSLAQNIAVNLIHNLLLISFVKKTLMFLAFGCLMLACFIFLEKMLP